ncbi:unannotated protein [freshwater metagenome]|uniref:Unannotated protein n=1 Tax=freshwater metagenome TaxID=449393 RepID=A0A6J6EGP8_9ZZZZ|nr:hypothetical protein [Actinomycetota bacterium]
MTDHNLVFDELLKLSDFPAAQGRPETRVDSALIREGEAAVRAGEPIPRSCYSQFDGFTRYLSPNLELQQKQRAADNWLALVIASGLARHGNITLALVQDGDAGGPYLDITSIDEHIEASLVSNYRILEPKENWFQGVMSLYEWTSIPTSILSTRIYRKVWPAGFSPVVLGSVIAELLVFVFDALRAVSFSILVSFADDPIFDLVPANLFVGPLGVNDTFAQQAIAATRRLEMIPSMSIRAASDELSLGAVSVPEAYEIAADNGDEVGMDTLKQLMSDLKFRAIYAEQTRFALGTILGTARDNLA